MDEEHKNIASEMEDEIILDEVEKSPAYLEVVKQVDEEAKKIVDSSLGKGRHMGACHLFWSSKKKILKEKYNIDWHSPAEMNQSCRFD